jgi:predicted DNA-binding transcriptional regulator AlpA
MIRDHEGFRTNRQFEQTKDQAVRSSPNAIIHSPPLALRRKEAAAALGMSVSLFEREVTRGRLPKPRKLADRSTAWLYEELKAAANALPISDIQPGPGRKREPEACKKTSV